MFGDNMRFKKVYIEITNICNLQCSFCVKNTRVARYMQVAQFRHIVEQIQPYTNYIYLHVLGEPLMHPQLQEILAIAKQYSMQVNMTTNGVLLKEQLPMLVNNIRQLNISLHSQPKQDGIHSDTYLQDCLYCGDELAKQGTYISYRLWNMKAGVLDEESLSIQKQIEQHYGISMEQGTQLRLAERRFLHFEEEFAWPSLQAERIGSTGTCYGMRSMCGILVDGSVVPCCLDSKGDCVLGNIFETSMAKILAQERTRTMCEGFARRQLVEEICQHCGYRTRFDKEE